MAYQVNADGQLVDENGVPVRMAGGIGPSLFGMGKANEPAPAPPAPTPAPEPEKAAPPSSPATSPAPEPAAPLTAGGTTTKSVTTTDTSRVKDTPEWRAARAKQDAASTAVVEAADRSAAEGAAIATEQGEADAAVHEVESRRAEERAKIRQRVELEKAERKKELDAKIEADVSKAKARDEQIRATKYSRSFADFSTGERVFARIGMIVAGLFQTGDKNVVREAIDRDLARDNQILREQYERDLAALGRDNAGVETLRKLRAEALDEIELRGAHQMALVGEQLDAQAARAKIPGARIAARKMGLEYKQRADEKRAEVFERVATRAEAFHSTVAPRVQSRTVTEAESGPGAGDQRKPAEGEQIKAYAANQVLKDRAAKVSALLHKNPKALEELQKNVIDFRSDENNAVGSSIRGFGRIIGLGKKVETDKLSKDAKELHALITELNGGYQAGSGLGSSDDDAKRAEQAVGAYSLDPNAFVARLKSLSEEAEQRNRLLAQQRKFSDRAPDGSPMGAPAQPAPTSNGQIKVVRNKKTGELRRVRIAADGRMRPVD